MINQTLTEELQKLNKSEILSDTVDDYTEVFQMMRMTLGLCGYYGNEEEKVFEHLARFRGCMVAKFIVLMLDRCQEYQSIKEKITQVHNDMKFIQHNVSVIFQHTDMHDGFLEMHKSDMEFIRENVMDALKKIEE